jgi:hypothetical protein
MNAGVERRAPGRRWRAALGVALGLAVCVLAGCTDKGSFVEAQQPHVHPTFSGDIQPILRASCAQDFCHGASPANDLDLRPAVAHAELVGVTSVGYAPARRVVVGNPDASVLFHKVAGTGRYGGAMPPTGPLTPAQVEVIRHWIADGAEDN